MLTRDLDMHPLEGNRKQGCYHLAKISIPFHPEQVSIGLNLTWSWLLSRKQFDHGTKLYEAEGIRLRVGMGLEGIYVGISSSINAALEFLPLKLGRRSELFPKIFWNACLHIDWFQKRWAHTTSQHRDNHLPLLPQSAQEMSSSGFFSRFCSFVPRQKLQIGIGSATGYKGKKYIQGFRHIAKHRD